MPNGGKLTIGAHKENDDTVLSVKDTGVGIPKEIHKMFTLISRRNPRGKASVCQLLNEWLNLRWNCYV